MSSEESLKVGFLLGLKEEEEEEDGREVSTFFERFSFSFSFSFLFFCFGATGFEDVDDNEAAELSACKRCWCCESVSEDEDEDGVGDGVGVGDGDGDGLCFLGFDREEGFGSVSVFDSGEDKAVIEGSISPLIFAVDSFGRFFLVFFFGSDLSVFESDIEPCC